LPRLLRSSQPRRSTRICSKEGGARPVYLCCFIEGSGVAMQLTVRRPLALQVSKVNTAP
jgi:hypothetical protein